MMLEGFFFFVKSMKEIIHPVPASWMEASSVQILLNLFKCLNSAQCTKIASRVLLIHHENPAWLLPRTSH